MTASSETASQIFILRKFLRRIDWLDMFGYFSTEELLILVWDVSQKFSEKKSVFGYYFSETNI